MISVILPTYNEADNIEPFIEAAQKTLNKNNIRGEMIVVDDNSPDGTSKIVEKMIKSKKYTLRLLCRKDRKGKGSAVVEGANISKYDIVAMIDTDFQHDPDDIIKLLKKMKDNNTDIVVGRRTYQNVSFVRKIFSFGFRVVQKLFLRLGISDCQCGLKVFKKKVFDAVCIEEKSFAFDIELLLKARKKGFTMDEVPVKFYERAKGQTKVSITKVSFDFLFKCLFWKIKTMF